MSTDNRIIRTFVILLICFLIVTQDIPLSALLASALVLLIIFLFPEERD